MALLHVNFFAETLGMERRMDVILPQRENGIGAAEGGEQASVPVLYLLHGASDDHTIWQRRTSIERYALQKDLAVVMPSADLSFYADMKYGYDFYQFFSKELPGIVRELFPMISRDREKTFVAGLSMGGFGALKLGINCPEIFSHAASLSGVIDLPALGDSPLLQNAVGDGMSAEKTINDLPYRLEEQLKKGVRLPRFFVCCGTEDFLYTQNTAFKERFSSRIDLTYHEESGTHEWGFWDRNIQRVLDWLPLQRGGAR